MEHLQKVIALRQYCKYFRRLKLQTFKNFGLFYFQTLFNFVGIKIFRIFFGSNVLAVKLGNTHLSSAKSGEKLTMPTKRGKTRNQSQGRYIKADYCRTSAGKHV